MLLFKLKKLAILAVIIFLGILGFNAYINYLSYGFKRGKETERLTKQKEREAKEKLDLEIAEMQRDAMSG
jgi:cell division protein FtsB